MRTGTVRSAENYRWSSYRGTAGLEKPEPFLTVDWILGQFGTKRSQAQKSYRQFVREGIETSSPWEELRGGVILGSETFMERMEPFLEDKMTSREIPRAERFAHRPPLGKIVSSGQFKSKQARDRAVREAHVSYGYTIVEIARQLGLHYTTISKVVNQKAS